MTGRIAEIVAEMRALAGPTDPEIAHGEADDLLCEAVALLGLPELAAAFEAVPRWYA